MEDLNSITLVCRLTADPELRSLSSGTSVCSMRVAFNTSKKGSSGEWEDVANFVSVTVWGNHGETCAKHLSKGKRVALKGRLQYREWQAEGGGTRSTIEIVADRVQFIEPRSDSQPSQAREGAAPLPTNDDVPF